METTKPSTDKGYIIHPKFKKWVGHGIAYIILGAWSAFTIFSMLWVVVSSLKNNRELFTDVWSLPASPMWQNYVKAWSVVKMGQYFTNSLFVVAVSVFLILLVSAPAAYILTRVKFRGSGFISSLFTAGMGIPYPLLFVPLFGLLTSMRINDTLGGLILVYVCLSIPFTVFLLGGFFSSLPVELEESAALDGAGPFQTFRQVMLPLASPGLLTAAIFNAIGLWNEYMLALIFITSPEKRTLSLGLYALQSSMQYTGDWGGLFAGVVIVMLPTAILFIFLSQKMISGITLGAVK